MYKLQMFRTMVLFILLSVTSVSFLSTWTYALSISFSPSSGDSGLLSNGEIFFEVIPKTVTHDFQDGETFFMDISSIAIGPSLSATGPLINDQHASALTGSWIVNSSSNFPFGSITIDFTTFPGGFSCGGTGFPLTSIDLGDFGTLEYSASVSSGSVGGSGPIPGSSKSVSLPIPVTYHAPDPTVVSLLYFTATSYIRGNVLLWETGSEIDNAGFNIWRSKGNNSPFTKINEFLILGKGGMALGAEYSYKDNTNVVRGQAYYYMLEDVEFDGKSTLHGPISVDAENKILIRKEINN